MDDHSGFPERVAPKENYQRVSLNWAVALVVLAMAVGTITGGAATRFMMKNSPYYTAPEEMIECTAIGGDDGVSVTFLRTRVSDAQSLTLTLTYDDYAAVGTTPTTIVRETPIDKVVFSEDARGSMSVGTSPLIMAGLRSVTLTIAGLDGDETFTIDSPPQIASSPNGPDCEPHLHNVYLELKDDLVPLETE